MTATLTIESREFEPIWHGPVTLEQHVKLELAARILRRAGALAYVARTRRTEVDFVSIVEWLDAAKADLAAEGISKRAINWSMPFALATFDRKLFHHKPQLSHAVRLFAAAPYRLNAMKVAKFPTRVKGAAEPQTILDTRALPREVRLAGYAAIEYVATSAVSQEELDARVDADAKRAGDATKSLAWERQYARRLNEPARVDSEVDYATVDQLTVLDRQLQLAFFPPLILRGQKFQDVTAALDGANQVLLALNPVVPGRYHVVRSTTQAIKPGLVLDGDDQQRVNRWVAAGGTVFVARPHREYAIDAVCERHPWGSTPEKLWAVDPNSGKTIDTFLVGDELYTWGAKAAAERTTCSEAASRRFRQVNACPVCLLPVENPVVSRNRDAISAYRRERVAAVMAVRNAGGKVSRRDAEQLDVVRDGKSVPLGPEPKLTIEGTIYRVANDAGADWWRSASDVMKATGHGPYPKNGSRDARDAWIAQAETHVRRPKDTLTFTTEAADEERETSPRVVGDPIRDAEDAEREAQALVRHLQRPV